MCQQHIQHQHRQEASGLQITVQTDGNASKLTDSATLLYADMRSAVASNQPSLGMDSACKLRLWISAIASAVVELGRSPGSSGVHTDGWH